MKRIVSLSIVLAILLSVVAIPVFATQGIYGSLQTQNIAEVETILDLYKSNPDVDYSVVKQKTLKSLADGEDAYTLYELSPYGYAIFLNEPLTIMQACFTEDAVLPVNIDNSTVYYYGGPLEYYTKVGDMYYHVSEDRAIANLENLKIREDNIRTYLEARASEKSGVLERNQRSTLLSRYAGRYYFSDLTHYGNNVKGTCTVVAACMLLRYYDYMGYNNNFVATKYHNGTGTTDQFHLDMNRSVYGTPYPENGAIYIREINGTIDDYLEGQGVLASFSSYYYLLSANMVSPVISKISSGHPVIASMSTNRGADINHTVLVYGVIYNESDPSGTANYVVHMGQSAGSEVGACTQINALWFYEYGHIVL